MARGILAGIAAGVVVAGLGLGTASLVVGPVEMPGAAAPEPAVAPLPEAVAEDAGDAEAPTPEAEPMTAVDGEPPAPEGDDRTESDVPAPDLEAEEQAPPQEPSPEATAPIETAPADGQPPEPGANDDTGSEAPTPEAGAASDEMQGEPVVPGQSGQEVATAGAVEGEGPTDDGEDRSDAPEEVTVAEPATDPVAGPDDAIEPVAGAAPETPPAVAAEDDARDAPGAPPVDETVAAAPPALMSDPEPEAEQAPEAPPVDDATTTAPGAEAETAARAPTVVTGRLPSIGDEAAAPDDEPARAPALERNAMAFAAPDELPLMALLLIDTGADRAGFADLGKLPFPVTVAIDAGALDAAEAIAFYRAQGLEVVTILPLPEGATAADIEINLEAYARFLEDSVAAMAEEGLGFQALGEGAVQLAVNLAETGHGLVSFPAGLNTGHKVAQKEGVRAGLVFRDLDGEGQSGPVIRRFLDNAAFRARNEERVIVVARTREETVQALLEWSLGTRAASVTLAPISTVLRAE